MWSAKGGLLSILRLLVGAIRGKGVSSGELCGHWLQRQRNLDGGICELKSNNIYLWRYEHNFKIVRIGGRDLFGVG